MYTDVYESGYFNIKDTLECGQVFRFRPYKNGYLVFSRDKACYAHTEGEKTYVVSDDGEYFRKYFDIERDYAAICGFAENSAYEVVRLASRAGKGIRILSQDEEETLFSFIISQNNNIPRIKKCIESMCRNLGERKEFSGEEYYTFPTADAILSAGEEFFKENGFGYRAGYMVDCASAIKNGFDLSAISEKPTDELKSALLKIRGVGPKVADCVSLFGFHRTDSFPVDTWIEKLYREDFRGELKDRKKIAGFFRGEFGENSGYVQQYIFHYKRNLTE